MAERLERIARRMFTRRVRRHDVEPDLRDRLWADGEVRAFWLSQARDLLDGHRHARNRRLPSFDGKDTS